MTQPPPPELRANASDDEVKEFLTSSLSTRPLSPEALERVRSAVAQTWEATLVPSRTAQSRQPTLTRGHWVSLAIAASLVAATLTFIAFRPVGQREMVGSLSRTHEGGVELAQRFFGYRTLSVGAPLRVGDTLTARGSSLVLLAQGGTLRLAAGSVISVVAASQLQLERGAIYVDKPVDLLKFAPLRVETLTGLVEHLGTEFEVVSNDQGVRIRVREGQVRYSGALGVMLADAGTELSASLNGQITRGPTPTFGRDWQWTAALAPDFAVDGHSLMDYLQWISRELGRPLLFADAQARESARRTVLHGPAQQLATLDGLAEVLSSTSLTYELVDGAIRVHSDR